MCDWKLEDWLNTNTRLFMDTNKYTEISPPLSILRRVSHDDTRSWSVNGELTVCFEISQNIFIGCVLTLW